MQVQNLPLEGPRSLGQENFMLGFHRKFETVSNLAVTTVTNASGFEPICDYSFDEVTGTSKKWWLGVFFPYSP